MIGVFVVSLMGLVGPSLALPHARLGMIRFGALHFLSFFLVMVVASIEDEQRQKERPGHPSELHPGANRGGDGRTAILFESK
jgi:hypothetical protein